MDSFFRAPGMGKGAVETLLRHALKKELTVAQCLSGSGISSDYVRNPIDVSVSQELIIINNLIKHLAKPFAMGFAVGLGVRMMDLGVVGLALMSCKNGAHAASVIARYVSHAYHFNHLDLVVEGGSIRIKISPRDELDEAVKQFVVARDLGIFYVMQTSALRGQARNTYEVGFDFDFLQGMEEVAKAFSCPVRHGQDSNYLICDKRQLKLQPPMSNPINAAAIELSYQQVLLKSVSDAGLASKIKEILMSNSHKNIQKKQVAEGLNISERTLARHLEKKGLSWRKMLSEIRLQKAEFLLLNSDKALQKITDEVGYASVSSLSHAFRKEKGLSPSSFRKSNLKTKLMLKPLP